MLNHFPLWKYLLLLAAVFFGVIYSLPNFYSANPAIQITSLFDNKTFDNFDITKVKNLLQQKNVCVKHICIINNSISISFYNNNDQLISYEILTEKLSKNYIINFTFLPKTPKWLICIGAQPVKLGLDLRGGIHFLMEVDVNNALINIYKQKMQNLSNDLKNKKINFTLKYEDKNLFGEIYSYNTKDIDKIIFWLSSKYHDLKFHKINNNYLKLSFSEKNLSIIINNTIKQNIFILRNRMHQLGMNETMIYRQGLNKIIVELPGMQDITLTKRILGTMTNIEFRLVNNNANLIKFINEGKIPEDSEIKYNQNGDRIFLYKTPILTGNHIINANCNFDEYNRPQVNIFLDKIGGKLMTNFTKNNIGKLIATLLIEKISINNYANKTLSNEKIINIATIQSILNNQFRITGLTDINVARKLAILLRSGILVAPIKIIEEKIIGPILGMKNIIQGVRACLYGLIISIVFIVFRYLIFGLIAATALILNLILVISMLSLIPGIVLTMSGIAGIILTLAIAVDANVLINERIKEELNNGRLIQQAIYAGYHGALPSILDANITTLIITAILYMIDTSFIQGFAIATFIGIITSMFTSILGTRAIVNLCYGHKFVDKLYI